MQNAEYFVPCKFGEIDILLVVVHLAAMDGQNALSTLLIRKGKFDFPIQTAGPQQSWIENIGTIRASNNLFSKSAKPL